jgi:hypothetical protein
VLDVSGAVLSWTVDAPSDATATHIAFTDPARADWLWRILGESGHAAVAAALDAHTPDPTEQIELSGIDLLPASVEPLRHLAFGHWLRRWWPVSARDGIAALDPALLDAEIAVLTAAAQDFFTDDTLDSDLAGLLAPHAAALAAHARDDDPRVLELVRACGELADELGVGAAAPGLVIGDRTLTTAGRDDYALAAGADGGRWASAAIASGVGSINWAAVPPGIFDAAENTIDWRIEVAGAGAVAVVRTALIGPQPATGIPIRLRSGSLRASSGLDADGRATLPLLDRQQQLVTESTAWDHDWSATSITVGADVEESPQTRERIRRFAQARLDRPAGDAFLAEVLAAESNY